MGQSQRPDRLPRRATEEASRYTGLEFRVDTLPKDINERHKHIDNLLKK